MKRCTKCGEEKELTEFHRCSTRPDGVSSWCKSCACAKAREYRLRDVEAFKARRKENELRNRDAANARRRERYHAQPSYALLAQKEYRDEHRAEISERRKKARWDFKMSVMRHYGERCACCGETEERFLCLDHVNGGGSKQRRALGGTGVAVYHWIVQNNYPTGFQVLCHNCNQAKGYYGRCPHEERTS